MIEGARGSLSRSVGSLTFWARWLRFPLQLRMRLLSAVWRWCVSVSNRSCGAFAAHVKKRKEGEYAMKNNAIWWIVLIVVVVLGVYFLVANRQLTPAPTPNVNTVTPGQDNSAPVAPSNKPGTSDPGTVSPSPSAPSDSSAPSAPSTDNGTVTNPSADNQPVTPTPAQ